MFPSLHCLVTYSPRYLVHSFHRPPRCADLSTALLIDCLPSPAVLYQESLPHPLSSQPFKPRMASQQTEEGPVGQPPSRSQRQSTTQHTPVTHAPAQVAYDFNFLQEYAQLMVLYMTLLEASMSVILRLAMPPNFSSSSRLQPQHSRQCHSSCQTGIEPFTTPRASSISACTASVGTTVIDLLPTSWSKFDLETGWSGVKFAWCCPPLLDTHEATWVCIGIHRFIHAPTAS